MIEVNAKSYIAFLIHDPYLNTLITKISRFLIGGLKKQFLTFELGGENTSLLISRFRVRLDLRNVSQMS